VKIGLIADSQGDIDALEYVCDLLVDEHGADRLFFLGGYWADVDELILRKRAEARGGGDYDDLAFLADVTSFIEKNESTTGTSRRLKKGDIDALASRFVRVPDRNSFQYRDPNVPHVLPELVGGKIASLVHDKGELTRDEIESGTLFLHGNSSEPNVVQIGPRFFITPGRLSGTDRRTFGLLAEGKSWSFVAYGLDGRALKTWDLSVGARTKMSAR